MIYSLSYLPTLKILSKTKMLIILLNPLSINTKTILVLKKFLTFLTIFKNNSSLKTIITKLIFVLLILKFLIFFVNSPTFSMKNLYYFQSNLTFKLNVSLLTILPKYSKMFFKPFTKTLILILSKNLNKCSSSSILMLKVVLIFSVLRYLNIFLPFVVIIFKKF